MSHKSTNRSTVSASYPVKVNFSFTHWQKRCHVQTLGLICSLLFTFPRSFNHSSTSSLSVQTSESVVTNLFLQPKGRARNWWEHFLKIHFLFKPVICLMIGCTGGHSSLLIHLCVTSCDLGGLVLLFSGLLFEPADFMQCSQSHVVWV